MPEDKIHVTVRFYLNGQYAIDYVPDEDLKEYVKYNTTYRFGCFHFVDGEYVGGGVLKQPYQDEFVAKCKKRLETMDLKPLPVTLPRIACNRPSCTY